nr:hypothetical protein [Tanacetum cinerariifolium]
MVKKSVLPTNVGKGTGHRERRPVWNNVQRINHQNKFAPIAVFTRSGRIPVSAAKAKAAASTNAAKLVNTIGPKQSVNFSKSRKAVSVVKGNKVTAVKTSAGNKAYLTDYNEINDGGFVAFGSSRGKISGKGTQDNVDAGKEVFDQHYIVLPLWSSISSTFKSSDDKATDDKPTDDTSLKTVQEPVNKEDQAYRDELDRLMSQEKDAYDDDLDIFDSLIQSVGAKDDFNNMKSSTIVNPIPTHRVHLDHPNDKILRDPKSAVQTRGMAKKSSGAHALMEPKKVSQALDDASRVKAMQDELLQFSLQKSEEGIFISQDKYVAEILKKFDFSFVKTTSTPIKTQKPLVKDEEASDVDVYIYRSMIGSLMYLTASRLDIIFAVFACSRFQVTPKLTHLYAMKRIFRYLKGQPKLGLWYPKDSPFDLEAYSDSDYAGAKLDKKSIIGGCQFLHRRLISCCARRRLLLLLLLLKQSILLLLTAVDRTEANVDFHQIVDFLSTCSINYALTVSSTIYASYIEQFWNTATSKTVNSVKQIYVIIDGKAVVISKSSVRSDLLFNDEDEVITSRSREDSMEHQDDLTDILPPTPYDSPLSGGRTCKSDKELDRAQKERQKQEEATIATLTKEFDEIQARMDADHELTEKETICSGKCKGNKEQTTYKNSSQEQDDYLPQTYGEKVSSHQGNAKEDVELEA